MMVTKDAALDTRLRALRTHGGVNRYFHDEVGWNSRLDALQVAVLEVKLPLLAAWSDARAANARFYDEALRGLDGVTTPPVLPGKKHIYNQYMLRCSRRDALQEHLAKAGVGTAVYYPLSLHEQKCFADLGYRKGQFPESERACLENLSIPVHPELTDAERSYVAEQIRAFYGA
jgi:dTDP-4-amino-4,6-dideoxygalactose transaminase